MTSLPQHRGESHGHTSPLEGEGYFITHSSFHPVDVEARAS